ncbi:hypothetical protein EH230_11875 [Flavobacterium columnare]|uniref:Uncharacterized protein n=1 Tax=Flavobacterium columnare TaxID=996 RepID=A0A437UD76_9FLAO|nr:hypothetical protein [Flavobacterium columnare]RVU91541.1 hypothetical protein EH230_11875 [Flavobacterium columnare]
MEKINYKYFVPTIGSLIVILGIIKEYIYYSLFEHDILKYIDISEVFLLFAKDLSMILFSLILLGLIFFFLSNNKQEDIVVFKKNWDLSLKERFLFFVKDSFYLNFLLLNLFGIRELNFIYKFRNEWEINHFIILYIIIYLFRFIYDEIIRHYTLGHNKKLPIFHDTMIHFSFLLYFLIIGKTYIDYREIIDNKTKNQISFQIENKIIKSDKTFLFIGQTKNYIFFHDKIKKVNSIYKISDIKNLKE